MKALEEKIRKEGKVLSADVLKVGNFLNQQLDTAFIYQMGKEIARLYKKDKITKIMTIEAPGIAIAMAAAFYMKVPVVFAKKSRASTQTGEMLSAQVHSFTHGNTYSAIVPAQYLSEGDRLLIVDDFLANGAALEGLLSIARHGKAEVVGCAVAVEKGFQGGGDKLRAEGVRIDSLALIDSMSVENGITFRA